MLRMTIFEGNVTGAGKNGSKPRTATRTTNERVQHMARWTPHSRHAGKLGHAWRGRLPFANHPLAVRAFWISGQEPLQRSSCWLSRLRLGASHKPKALVANMPFSAGVDGCHRVQTRSVGSDRTALRCRGHTQIQKPSSASETRVSSIIYLMRFMDGREKACACLIDHLYSSPQSDARSRVDRRQRAKPARCSRSTEHYLAIAAV